IDIPDGHRTARRRTAPRRNFLDVPITLRLWGLRFALRLQALQLREESLCLLLEWPLVARDQHEFMFVNHADGRDIHLAQFRRVRFIADVVVVLVTGDEVLDFELPLGTTDIRSDQRALPARDAGAPKSREGELVHAQALENAARP